MASFQQSSLILIPTERTMSPSSSSVFSLDSLETANTTTTTTTSIQSWQEPYFNGSSPQHAKKPFLQTGLHSSKPQSQPFIACNSISSNNNNNNNSCQISINTSNYSNSKSEVQSQVNQQSLNINLTTYHSSSSSTSIQLSPNPLMHYQSTSKHLSMQQFQFCPEFNPNLPQEHILLQQFHPNQRLQHSSYFSPQKIHKQQQNSNDNLVSPMIRQNFNTIRRLSATSSEKKGMPSSQDSSSNEVRSKAISDDAHKYKTELCNAFRITGQCEYRHKCRFAHGNHELNKKQLHQSSTMILRQQESQYFPMKTKPCKQYYEKLYCPYGSRCHFQHDTRSIKQIQTERIYQKKMASEEFLHNFEGDLLNDEHHQQQSQVTQQKSKKKSVRLPIFNYICSGNLPLFPSKKSSPNQ